MIYDLSTGFQIETAIATKDDILRAINKYYDIDEGFEELLDESSRCRGENEENINRSEIPQLFVLSINYYQMQLAMKASDIHIDPHETK